LNAHNSFFDQELNSLNKGIIINLSICPPSSIVFNPSWNFI